MEGRTWLRFVDPEMHAGWGQAAAISGLELTTPRQEAVDNSDREVHRGT